MKIIIKTLDDLYSMQIKDKNKVVQWGDLSRSEQIKLLNAIAGNYALFSKFLKIED